MEVTNRFKGLDLIDRVPEELWTEVRDTVPEAVIKIVPKKKKYKKAKWLFEEALQIVEKRREEKIKGEKKTYTHLNEEFQGIIRRDKKAFLSNQCKQMRKTIEWERLEISSRKLETPREHFMQKMGRIKNRNGMDLTEAEDTNKRWQEYTQDLYKKIFTTQIITMVCSLTLI